ncbi:MAG: hypothetical protein RLZZ436_1300, partial [Planctomycetota bacterium]
IAFGIAFAAIMSGRAEAPGCVSHPGAHTCPRRQRCVGSALYPRAAALRLSIAAAWRLIRSHFSLLTPHFHASPFFSSPLSTLYFLPQRPLPAGSRPAAHACFLTSHFSLHFPLHFLPSIHSRSVASAPGCDLHPGAHPCPRRQRVATALYPQAAARRLSAFSLLTSHFSLLTSPFSLLTSHFSLLTSHFSILTLSTLASALYPQAAALRLMSGGSPRLRFGALMPTRPAALAARCQGSLPAGSRPAAHARSHFSLLTSHFSLLTSHFSLLTSYALHSRQGSLPQPHHHPLNTRIIPDNPHPFITLCHSVYSVVKPVFSVVKPGPHPFNPPATPPATCRRTF